MSGSAAAGSNWTCVVGPKASAGQCVANGEGAVTSDTSACSNVGNLAVGATSACVNGNTATGYGTNCVNGPSGARGNVTGGNACNAGAGLQK